MTTFAPPALLPTDAGPPPADAARRLSVAPMLDWTDRHCRYFLRLITRRSLLYTEMITTGAILHGDPARQLDFDAAEHPLALQLGGSDPATLAACARIGAEWGYDEINLNCGCPSDRVQEGRFGACLLAEPDLVAECVAAMRAALPAPVPVTVKTRIGIDDRDAYEHLHDFVARVAAAGCRTFVIHARKAWLSGLSPKENREIPPLRYDVAERLKRDFPALAIVLNGGVRTLDAAIVQLDWADGVMLGRAAYENPWLLADADRRLFGDPTPAPARGEVIERLIPYVERHLAGGGRLGHISRHLLGLFQGLPGARGWRRHLSEHAHRADADAALLRAAAARVSARVSARHSADDARA
ncbi:tRNA-U16,U17-dihydrouridine synthase [Plasticicumulans lactativorans]|uniref:tRNA-dihydrouridine(20/20a) synthase n=1 Tax=Plasticicumulans lactativorans TaxID=1133106 RepID=A0A4R2LTC9_9GAMM|nr:tRNA dihydrouridine(20/20a) synthase DusA [Plasticicumulans lactativorans]TCO83042.1 tRNA-U16,U17-dihydrouridine synthase [Plasticicumulans lactativorans]